MAASTMAQQAFILLVEDDDLSRKTIADSLIEAGYMVFEAATFSQALDQMAVKPHLAILDITLPDAPGWEVAEWLEDHHLKESRQVPIIAISSSPPEQEDLQEFKPRAYLRKPFAVGELLDLVRKYVPVPE